MTKYLPFDKKSPLALWPVPWYLRWLGDWRLREEDGEWRYLSRSEYRRLFTPQPAKPKLTDTELTALLEPFLQYEGSRLVHFKSQASYRLREVVLRESDMTVWFTYMAVGNPRLKFSRPIEELLDGRWVIGAFGLIDGDLAHI